MLELQQIKEQYPPNLQIYEKTILREYLQHKVLHAIFESKYADRITPSDKAQPGFSIWYVNRVLQANLNPKFDPSADWLQAKGFPVPQASSQY